MHLAAPRVRVVGSRPREVPAMFRAITSRLSYANVTSSLALFIALGTGSAYAVNTIGSEDVKNGSLLSEDIHDGTLRYTDIAPETIGTGRIADGSLKGR